MCIFLFWESERARERGTEREGDRESQAGSCTVSTELYVGLELMNREIMTWVEIKSRMLNQLSHPHAPSMAVVYYFSFGLREEPVQSPSGDPSPTARPGGKRGWANRKPCSSVSIEEKCSCTFVVLKFKGLVSLWPGSQGEPCADYGEISGSHCLIGTDEGQEDEDGQRATCSTSSPAEATLVSSHSWRLCSSGCFSPSLETSWPFGFISASEPRVYSLQVPTALWHLLLHLLHL